MTRAADDGQDPSFTSDLFGFLEELAANNDRTWFQANKARYEEAVKEPALAFIEDVGYLLPEISPHLVAEPRSLFRIHRDTRFAKDKTPYKTHAGIYFRHRLAKERQTPGLYLHLEPGSVFMGAGIWHPDSAALKRIRDAIVARPEAWQAALEEVSPHWSLAEGESLKRAPAGYDPGHPLIEDLKRKNFAMLSRMSPRQATGRGFLAEWETRARASAPFLRFLCGALRVEF